MTSKKQSSFFNACLTCLLLLTSLQIAYTSISSAEDLPVFTLGVIPQFKMHRMHAIWQPVIKNLEKRTGFKIKLIVPNSIPEFEGRLLSGEFDFAYMNPYEVLLANKSAGYLPVAFDKSRKLQGIIVAKKNGDIRDISQLDGKDVAFPSFNALGASLLVRAELKDKHNITVNSRYLRSHDSVYFNVVQGNISAGGGVQKSLANQPSMLQSKLKVIYKTQEVSAHPFAVHPRIKKNISQHFYQALLDMSQTPDGLKKLERIPLSSISPAKLTDYKALSNMQLHRYYSQ
ncbi:MAG: phosphate ABC transporter [endosymbiont of Galathealinum brachiosum]|uniref:Phosphate ABC transporter n=1 Tax=endosymbiont of Galathealinum brachiosum TaxID=2200906 RepID=A0A370DBA6_9GAMM|nr:MAG: phosphate ABC transporter [endosymbiont of Galathealinum brachiosum]